MSQSSADARKKIKGTIEFLIAREVEITIRIEGHERPFVTRITEADYGDISSGRMRLPRLLRASTGCQKTCRCNGAGAIQRPGF